MSLSLDNFIRDMIPSEGGLPETLAEVEAHGVPVEPAGLPGHSVERLMASGGMGAVYAARQHSLEREVAVKVMTRRADRPEMVERFRREAWILGRLEHPNIVPIHEVGVDAEGRAFYSMKLVKGRTLQAILNDLRDMEAGTLRAFPLNARLGIFLKMCDALAFAHSHGTIHRDLKPENIMVGAFGEVLVMDWGLAKILKEKCRGLDAEPENDQGHSTSPESLARTLDGSVMGTPQYMAPEQALGQMDQIDERSDIFSLGGILYAILTLRPPVEGITLHEVLERVRTGSIPPPPFIQDGNRAATAGSTGPMERPALVAKRVPAALSAVVMKSLQRDKALRYASVAALRADIEAYLAGFATSAEEASPWKQLTLWVRRHRGASIGLAATLLIGGTLGAHALMEGLRAEQALRDLGRTAPVFYSQARLDFDEGKRDEALEKIGYATQLDAGNVAYHRFRADLHQSAMRLAEAAEGYRQVLALEPADAMARTNLELCEKLLRESGGGPLNRSQSVELLAALREQKRLTESAPLAAQFDKDFGTAKYVLDRRLQYWRNQAGWSSAKRVETRPDGTFEVDLQRLAPGDLSLLADQPITHLWLNEVAGSDISRLPRLPLKELSLYRSTVSDLSPLRGLPLEILDLSGLAVTDLSPLRGMKLQKLNINRSPAQDFSALAGMPLAELDCNECKQMFHLEFLQGAPMRRLHARHSALNNIASLADTPLDDLDIRACPVADLAPLAACTQLQSLTIRQTRVVDLDPLARLRLTWIDLGNTQIKSVEALRGQPLRFIRMQGAPVADVSPLADCKELEEIILPENATGVESLRSLPKLLRISKVGTSDYHPTQTAEEFWGEFDKERGLKR